MRRGEQGRAASVVLRVDVAPSLLRWAVDRSARPVTDLQAKFPRLQQWERGETSPTFKQLESFAKATYTPLGYFFLPAPPQEELPVPDYRTLRNSGVRRPSANLLDAIYLCEQRQEWFREYAIANGLDRVGFVGRGEFSSASDVAQDMRRVLQFDMDRRGEFPNWSSALSGLADRAEQAGALVMISGIVGSNTRRVLDAEEFRGFALVDDFAPLIFVNGTDTKAAQIFTLAHELAHLWVGQSAVSTPDLEETEVVAEHDVERRCNQIAAEFLVPLESLSSAFDRRADLTKELDRLARVYKVSTLVILRRAHDAGHLSTAEFRVAYSMCGTPRWGGRISWLGWGTTCFILARSRRCAAAQLAGNQRLGSGCRLPGCCH